MSNLIQISEQIRDHLIKQNAQAGIEGDCLYRTENGNMCAVGCLIKDEHYHASFEGKGIYDKVIRKAIEASIGLHVEYRQLGSDTPVYNLLFNWQCYHDDEYLAHVEDRSYYGKKAQTPAEYHDRLISTPDFNSVASE